MSIDFERRFGGLRRLYGMEGSQRIFDAHVVVVGIGGVGSWAVEALARSGVRRLTLIDMDHVSESNINRQIHALDTTLGQSKVLAMRERIAQFHPACVVDVIDDFVTPENWPQALDAIGVEADAGGLGLIDACDQVRAKTALAAWALNQHVPLVTVGAAGGKRQAHAVDMADLADTTRDPWAPSSSAVPMNRRGRLARARSWRRWNSASRTTPRPWSACGPAAPPWA